MVASDRISAFDVIMAEPIPDKGRVLTAMTAFWLEELADLAPNHLISADVGRLPRGAAALPGGLDGLAGRSMLVHRAEMLRHRVHRARLPVRLGLQGVRADGHRPRHGHARRPPPRRPAARAASSPPRPRPPRATTSTSAWPRPSTWWAGRRPRRQPSSAWPPTARAAARAEDQGIVICDTKFELGFIDGAAVHLRRGADPGLLPVLARRRLRAGDQPALVRQAAAARLARGTTLGQAAAPAARCPTRSWPPPRRATSTPTNGSAAVGWPTGTVPDRGRLGPTSRYWSRCGCGRGSPTRRAPPSSGPCPHWDSTG